MKHFITLIAITASVFSFAQESTEFNNQNTFLSDQRDGTESFESVYQLIERTLPGYSDAFILKDLNSTEYESAFRISSKQEKILLEGTDKIALAKGFYHYLRHYLHGSIAICGNQIPNFDALPVIDHPVFMGTQTQYRYSFNYCTFNYSFSFWDWDDWEKEIDWLAMLGVNLPLAIIGTEAVWQNTLKQFDFSDEEIEAFIPGPAYNSWWLMDNLEGWGGPVSQEWIENRKELQVKIVKRMRELGMNPIFPAFFGMLPNSAIEKFPESKIYKDAMWNGFRRPAFIDPGDSLFANMARVFYSEQEKLYGKALFYSGDPFHEGGLQPENVVLAASNIQAAMQKHSPKSTWVLQGWQKNPTDALLSGTDKDHTLVLDLFAERSPMYEKREAFGGRNFIWCNINNFGNGTYMFANFDSISTVPLKLLDHKYSGYYKGIGICAEGDLSDPMVYDLFYDMAWQSPSFRMDDWLDSYSEYRYGVRNKQAGRAIALIANSVYRAPDRTESLICARPSLTVDRVTTWGPGVKPVYEQDSLFAALDCLLSIEDEYIVETETYRFDISNVCRQLLTGISYDLYHKIRDSYNKGDLEAFKRYSENFLDLILFADTVVSAMPRYSLYEWQEDAQNLATSSKEKELFLWNANRLISLWGGEKGSKTTHDYAYHEWYGMLSGFYHVRWEMYFDYLSDLLEGKTAEEPDFYSFEDKWSHVALVKPERNTSPVKETIKRIYNYIPVD